MVKKYIIAATLALGLLGGLAPAVEAPIGDHARCIKVFTYAHFGTKSEYLDWKLACRYGPTSFFCTSEEGPNNCMKVLGR